MNLTTAQEGKEYIIQRIETDDEDLDSFLFSLGCYSGEPVTVVSRRKGGCTVSIKDGLKRTGGYCPCRLERSEENKCICKEFREQIADPDFKGYCHCMLYYKD